MNFVDNDFGMYLGYSITGYFYYLSCVCLSVYFENLKNNMVNNLYTRDSGNNNDFMDDMDILFSFYITFLNKIIFMMLRTDIDFEICLRSPSFNKT